MRGAIQSFVNDLKGQLNKIGYMSDYESGCNDTRESVIEELEEILNSQALSWKDVFNGHKRLFQDMYGAAQRAIDAGYEYLAWNGWVYKLESNPIAAKRTDILVEKLT